MRQLGHEPHFAASSARIDGPHRCHVSYRRLQLKKESPRRTRRAQRIRTDKRDAFGGERSRDAQMVAGTGRVPSAEELATSADDTRRVPATLEFNRSFLSVRSGEPRRMWFRHGVLAVTSEGDGVRGQLREP
jgi:hypothetical protein